MNFRDWRHGRRHAAAVKASCATLAMLALGASAQTIPAPATLPLAPLNSVSVPEPPNLKQFLRTDSTGKITPAARQAAIQLGKALFWDAAVGSDGQACASCHFAAGADNRTRNQLNPGFRAVPPDNTNFSFGGADYPLRAADFPFFTAHPGTNDIVSSQGVTRDNFFDIAPPSPTDLCAPISGTPCSIDPLFQAGGKSVRAAEPRNTPTVINAVFNYRNFWDGRARFEFNGVNPIGDLDPYARVLLVCSNSPSPASDPLGKCVPGQGTLQKARLNGTAKLEFSSLASQAVGPVLSDLEMSFGGRTFAKVGKKLLLLPALAQQKVAADDSVLGAVADPTQGLTTTYKALIQAAFQDKWYNSPLVVTIPGGTDPDHTIKLTIGATAPASVPPTSRFNQMEFNFSLFWGIAVQMYESTLIADRTPFDTALASGNPMAYTGPGWGDAEKLGLDVFQNKGKCVACHGGAELTNASVRNVQNEKLERMLMGNNAPAVYDNGFYNTAVTRCAGNIAGACDDLGIGATIGPLNLPLSMSRFFQMPDNCGLGSLVISGATFTGCTAAPLIPARPLEGISFALLQPNERVAVDGAFKTPGLRNVELTAPYFHNGGDASLRDIVNFYDRGGNFAAFNQNNLDPNIEPLGLTDAEKDGLVALLIAMTDDRVRHQAAPFDHPALLVPNLNSDGLTALLPAVGAGGTPTLLPTFASKLQ